MTTVRDVILRTVPVEDLEMTVKDYVVAHYPKAEADLIDGCWFIHNGGAGAIGASSASEESAWVGAARFILRR